MKKKMMMFIPFFAVVIILAIVAIRYFTIPTYKVPASSTQLHEDLLKDNIVMRDGKPELIALCQTEDEARQIAMQYGIDFEAFGEGIAIFTTDKDVNEVISFGIKNELPPVSPNIIRKLNVNDKTGMTEP